VDLANVTMDPRGSFQYWALNYTLDGARVLVDAVLAVWIGMFFGYRNKVNPGAESLTRFERLWHCILFFAPGRNSQRLHHEFRKPIYITDIVLFSQSPAFDHSIYEHDGCCQLSIATHSLEHKSAMVIAPIN
jgi:hypothetical protein